jgi:hypothetical protein
MYINNFRHLAKACRAAGLTGIYFDYPILQNNFYDARGQSTDFVLNKYGTVISRIIDTKCTRNLCTHFDGIGAMEIYPDAFNTAISYECMRK